MFYLSAGFETEQDTVRTKILNLFILRKQMDQIEKGPLWLHAVSSLTEFDFLKAIDLINYSICVYFRQLCPLTGRN